MEQEQHLLKPMTATNVLLEIKNLPVDKSHGLDRFKAEFFKNHKDIVGSEVT